MSALAAAPAPPAPGPFPRPMTIVKARVCETDPTAATLLPCRVRQPNGTAFEGELPAWRHRSIQLGMLHHATRGYVEIVDGRRPPGGKTAFENRWRKDCFFPGGATGRRHWLDDALRHVAWLARLPRTEIAVVPSVRALNDGTKEAVTHTRWLWVDIDKPSALPMLEEFLAERPAHLRIESGGSGGQHAYWLLQNPLPAVIYDPVEGTVEEPIEQALRRLVHRLTRWETSAGNRVPIGADLAAAKRGQPMRLAGTVNYKRERHARIISADMALAPYSHDALVGDLPGPVPQSRPRMKGRTGTSDDPYQRISPPDYFLRLANVEVPYSGKVRCPAPDHEDNDPSCHVDADPETGWWCFGCGRGGGIYQLASMLQGGPVAPGTLRDQAFKTAKALVVERFGEL